jgi:hypothetical protein
MSRYERRVYFDKLCELRDWYAARDSDDSVWVLRLGELDEYAASIWAAAAAAEVFHAGDSEHAPVDESVGEPAPEAERDRGAARG